MVIEALEEKLDALEEVDEYFIACDNILDHLSYILREFKLRKARVGLRREEHRSP